MSMTLFVGGNLDGHVADVSDEWDRIDSPDIEPRITRLGDQVGRRIKIRTIGYERMRIRGQKHEFSVFRCSEIDVDMVIHLLIENYRGTNPRTAIPEEIRKEFELFCAGRNLSVERHPSDKTMYANQRIQFAWETFCLGMVAKRCEQ